MYVNPRHSRVLLSLHSFFMLRCPDSRKQGTAPGEWDPARGRFAAPGQARSGRGRTDVTFSPVSFIISCPHSLLFFPSIQKPIKVVDFGPDGPIRCSRCRAYINPFVDFREDGLKFDCNFCDGTNKGECHFSLQSHRRCWQVVSRHKLALDGMPGWMSLLTTLLLSFAVPDSYVCDLDQFGVRRDVRDRPELSMGSVEYAVPLDQFSVRPEPQVGLGHVPRFSTTFHFLSRSRSSCLLSKPLTMPRCRE